MRPLIHALGTLGIALMLSPPVASGTLHVDASHPGCPGTGTPAAPFCRIQDAIDAALPGDVVLVQPGTYTELIDFGGKAITVTSAAGPALTTISAPITPGGSVVRFTSGEGPASELSGFTITSGKGTVVNVFPGFSETAGGGIYCEASSPSILGNVIRSNAANFGGGIFCDGASPRIEGNTLSANSGEEGLGIHCTNASAPLILGNVIQDHVFGTCCGAGIYVEGGSAPVIQGNTITGNSSSTGAGIYITQSVAQVTGNTLASNFTDEDEGGGLAAFVSTGTVSDNIFQGNASQTRGGAVLSWGGALTIRGNTFSGNQADEGGAIASVAFAADTIRGNTFTGNFADFGSALFVASGGTAVAANDVRAGGGFGSAMRIDGAAVVQDNLLVDNPGGIDALNGAILRRNTITGSTFGGIAALQGAITVESCIVWGNGSGVLELGGLAAVSHSDVDGGFPGPGNISADPLFMDAPGGDHRLQPGSPCIDAGDPLDTTCGTDLAGGGRRQDGLLDGGLQVDMGALEFSQVALLVSQPLTTQERITLTTTGSALPTRVLVGVDTGVDCIAPWGTVLIDLGSPWVQRFLGTGPLSLTALQPAAASGLRLHLQAVVTDIAGVRGNTSNLASVALP